MHRIGCKDGSNIQYCFCDCLIDRCGASFAVSIVSEAFEGKRLLERHRLVNTALSEEMKDIHALSISKALTPKQWSDQQPAAAPAPKAPEPVAAAPVPEQPAAAVV